MVLNKRDLERAFSPKFKHKKTVRNVTSSEHLNTKSSSPSSNIKVFVRIRPLSDREHNQNQRSTIKVIDDKMLVFDPKEETQGFFFHGVQQKSRDIAKRPNKEMQFIYDRVFNGEATNSDVYQGSTHGIIATLLEGYNCSVFVYGATGAGKTHTMLGNKENPGITFLTMTELYEQIENLKPTKDIEIGITYLEVYNENVYDLINPSGPMHLRDDSHGGVLVAGMKVEKILSADQLFQLLQQGNLNRTQHPTDANAESSRSHAVFQVYVKILTKGSGEVKIAKLSMIDLAGSERASATGTVTARFKEGSNINKSLLALGNCINNLADGLRHIPYRDSKLTRLLKDSLGGNCHTVMIANVSPSVSSYEDTYNTLKYATRAKSIKSQLKKNVMSVNLRVEHYVNMCSQLSKENTELKDQVKALEQALRHPAVSPPRADPRYVDRLNELFQQKKQIHTEWLTLEAQVKLLQWRISCKNLLSNQMRQQMSQYEADYSQELLRQENSVAQLMARANSLMGKMSELWEHKKRHNEEYNKFAEEMEQAKVNKLLQNDVNLKELQCENAGLLIQATHYQKIINMQDKLVKDHQNVIDTLSKLCSEFRMLLRGRNLITDSMDSEYQAGMMKKGLKAVTWTDFMEDASDDDEGLTLSCASVRPYTSLSLSSMHSCSFPFMVPEVRVKMDLPQLPSTLNESAKQPTTLNESAKQDLNGTFVFEPTKFELPTAPKADDDEDKLRKTSFILPKGPPKSGSSVPFRKFTPARIKINSGNKENSSIKTKTNPKFLCPTPVRPKTALASRQVNIQEIDTPNIKVSLNGYKMTRDRERNHPNNHHPYIRSKVKRLGPSPHSASKVSKGLKL